MEMVIGKKIARRPSNSAMKRIALLCYLPALVWAQAFSFEIGSPVASQDFRFKSMAFVFRTTGCADPAHAEINAIAEGSANGVRRSIPLRVSASSKPGVYAVPHQWEAGMWVVVLNGSCGDAKAGAIIPYWPEMDFVGEVPVETIRVEVYPDGKSAFTMYEDDGNSLAYLKGAVAETAILCEASKPLVKLTLNPRAGNYEGMPSRRSYDLRIHVAKPGSVNVNGTKAEWTYESDAVCLSATEDSARKAPIVVDVAM